MIFRCAQCQELLPPGVRACPKCGLAFEAPTPAPAEASRAAVSWESSLLNRSANSSQRPSAPGDAVGGPAGSAFNSPVRRHSRVLLWVGGGVAGLLLLALLGWVGYNAWMQGRGGEISYVQHNAEGNRAFAAGDYARATDEYGDMIALRPRRVDGYVLRCMSEFRQGHWTPSVADATAGIGVTTSPGVLETLYFNRAEANNNRGREKEAIADYNQAEQEYHQAMSVNRFVGLYPQGHQPSPLMDSGQGGILAEISRGRGVAYWKSQDYIHSVAAFTTLIQNYPPLADDYGLRARAEFELGEYPAATKDFESTLRLDPSYVNAYIGLGKIADKTGQYAQEAVVYQRGITAAPGFVTFWVNLGWAECEAGQYAQSIASSHRAQMLGGNPSPANYNIALCYALMGNSAASSQAYGFAVAHGPGRDRELGLKDVQDALVKHPGSAPLHEAQAYLSGGAIP